MLIHAHNIFYCSKRLPNFFLADRLMNSDVHSHKTRSSHDFHRLASNSGPGSRTSLNICIKLWNDLPQQLKKYTWCRHFRKANKKITCFGKYLNYIQRISITTPSLFSFPLSIFFQLFNCYHSFLCCHLRYSPVILLCCATSSLGCSPTFLVAIFKQPVCCYLQ